MASTDVSANLAGYSHRVTEEAWATIRAGAGNGSGAAPGVKISCFDGAGVTWDEFKRGLLRFDTSGIGTGWTISSVVLWLYRPSSGANVFGGEVDIVNCTSFTSVGTGEFVKPGTTVQGNKAFSLLPTPPAWTTISLLTTSVTKGGTTYLGMRCSQDTDNSEPVTPSDGDSNEANFSGTSDPTYKPFLRITYTIPTTTITPAIVGHAKGTFAPASVTSDVTVTPGITSHSEGTYTPTITYEGGDRVVTPALLAGGTPTALTPISVSSSFPYYLEAGQAVGGPPGVFTPVVSSVASLPAPYSVILIGWDSHDGDTTQAFTMAVRSKGDEPVDLSSIDTITGTLTDTDGNVVISERPIHVINEAKGIVALQLYATDALDPDTYSVNLKLTRAAVVYDFPSSHPLWVTVWEAL